jgi:probable DNA repair protein
MRHAARGLFDAVNAGHTVLAPNAELAAALFDVVERMHVAAGHGVWATPRVRDFDGWLREQYAQRQLSDASLPRVLGDAEERELWRTVVLESDAGDEFLDPEGAARSARRARRTMLDYAIPKQALAAYATEEALAWLRWDAAFDERCRAFNSIAADRLLGQARPGTPGLVWIESPVWRPAARRWLNDHCAALLTPATGGPAAVSYRYAAASPDAELAAAAQWGRAQLDADPHFRAWVCVPDLHARRTRVVDAFDAILAPHRFSLTARVTAAAYAVAGGTPLADYAPVRSALAALAATAGPLPFEEWSSLLRMPELQASSAEAVAAARLDVALRAQAPSEGTFRDWLRLAERMTLDGAIVPVAALERLGAFWRALEAAHGEHRVSRWVSIWVEAFSAGPWALRHRWSSTEFQSVERFRDLLVTLATGDAVFGVRSAVSAARLVQRAARDTAFQPQTGIPPLWISAQIMDPWLTYDGLWIAGCSEERWPPALDPVPFLPVRLQRDHGVISASFELQQQRAAELQRRWAERAARCIFSCSAEAEGQSAAFSPMLPVAAPLEAGAALPRPHWRAALRRAPPLQSVDDEWAPPFAAGERTQGVATLRAQSRCAFRGFAETRLAASPLERPLPGFNARERGNMVHQALELIWTQLGSSARLAALPNEERQELVSNGVRRAIADQCARRDPGVRWRRREAPRLAALIDKWLRTEQQREPFEVESLEAGTEVARHGGLDFAVRIDRSDRLADGARVLIDYKTGATSPDWRGERPDNPQLPVYALLRPEGLVAVAYARVNADECCFVAETARGGIFKPRSRPSALEGMADFRSLIELWSTRIDAIAKEFAGGYAAVAPTLRACESCELQPLCRVPAALDEAD